MKQRNIELHNQCLCEIRWKIFKGKTSATPGLFCRHHDVFLDWLPFEDANYLIDQGIIKEAPYLVRKKPKRAKPKLSYNQRRLKRRSLAQCQ